MSILIGGGTGFIGRALSNHFRSLGKNIIVVTRFPKEENHVSWDDLRRDGLPKNVEVVINLSGRSIGEVDLKYLLSSYYLPYKKEVYKSRLYTTRLLAECIRNSSHPPRAFLNAAAIGIYPPSVTEIYTEDSMLVRDEEFIRDLCFKWEECAKLSDMPEVLQVQLRFGNVLGKEGDLVEAYHNLFSSGVGRIGSGYQWVSWIHLDDAVRMIDWVVMSKPSPLAKYKGGPINITSPEPVRMDKFCELYRKVLKVPYFFSIASPVVNVMFGERAELLLEGQRVLPQRALDGGFQFQYDDIYDAIEDIEID